MFKTKYALTLFVFMGLALAVLASSAPARQAQAQAASNCVLLDNPTTRGLMSAMFERNLLVACGRQNELPAVAPQTPLAPLFPTLTDVLVNDPSGDTGFTSHTQSETSIAVNENIGTICSAYNDSYIGLTQDRTVDD